MRDIFLSYKISRNYHKIWVCGEKDVQHRQAQEEHQQLGVRGTGKISYTRNRQDPSYY